MTECFYPDYKLSGTVLQNWLRTKFNDETIVVESKNAQFVFNLPNGTELTEDDKREISRLRHN